MLSAVHRYACRVYYEDTDLAGFVYHANYLKFIERGRSEWVRAIGIDQRALKSEKGLMFAVRRLEADFLSPARYDDELVVETATETVGGARIVLNQSVMRGDERLFAARVTLVTVNGAGRPKRLPAGLRGTPA